jgi:FkbM family methyltransferase
MKIFEREIAPTQILKKFFLIGRSVCRILIAFRQPLSFINYYIKGTSPTNGRLRMRNGMVIQLSDHPHDIITNFVVFGKKDYGVIRKNSVIVDIGANIGTFSLYAITNGAKKVYAIEPNSFSYETLLKNININNLEGRIVAFKAAVSDKDNEEVYIPIRSSPYNAITSDPLADGGNLERVQTISLATLVEREGIQAIDLLKVDCEGAEYQIIPALPPALLGRILEIKVEYLGGDINLIIDHLQRNSFVITKHEKEKRFDSGMIWAERS